VIITGSVIYVRPEDSAAVLRKLAEYPQITFHVGSDDGSELIVNFEAPTQDDLEPFCSMLKTEIPEIIDIGHVYINFEDEVASLTGNGEQD
jgi:nitrate reductase NapAB chaperone NapD